MTESTYTTRVLTPEEGHYITQSAEDTSTTDRVYSTSVYLAPADSPDNWREATEEEYQDWKQQMDEIQKSAMTSGSSTSEQSVIPPTEEPATEPSEATE